MDAYKMDADIPISHELNIRDHEQLYIILSMSLSIHLFNRIRLSTSILILQF